MDVISPAGAGYAINKLIDAAATYVRDQYYWKTDLQEELQSLKQLLPQIQAVVGFAEHRLTSYESSNPALMEWLWQFRDRIDEAEEVLDELEYRELEKKANSDKSKASRTVNASVKAAKRLLKFDDVLGRLRTCVKNLNTSASGIEKFVSLVTQTSGVGTGQMQQEIPPLRNQSRITSALPEYSFKGREVEKGLLIRSTSLFSDSDLQPGVPTDSPSFGNGVISDATGTPPLSLPTNSHPVHRVIDIRTEAIPAASVDRFLNSRIKKSNAFALGLFFASLGFLHFSLSNPHSGHHFTVALVLKFIVLIVSLLLYLCSCCSNPGPKSLKVQVSLLVLCVGLLLLAIFLPRHT